MKKYDIFVCYRGSSSKSGEIGTNMYGSIKKYNVFYAPKCLNKGDNFKTVIPDVMKSVSVVILLLDNGFFDNFGKPDDIVEYECREALSNPNIVFLPIYLNDFSFLDVDIDIFFSEEEVDRIKHINGIKYSGIYDFSIENDLLPVLDNIFNGGTKIDEMSERSEVRYYGASEEREKEFLRIQQELLYDFDSVVYDRIMMKKDNIIVLDLGCNDGLQTMKRFGSVSHVSRIIAIDRDPECIERANQAFQDKKCSFIQADVESDDFARKMDDYFTNNQIGKFDIINISMLILHLKRPVKFLRCIKRFLKKDGVVFIRDIDDGLNFAYPDPDRIFKKLTSICEYCDILGYRKSGRQIYSYLKEAGFSNVILERSGLDTSNMTDDEKETLFEIYFGYIPTALEKTISRTELLRAKHDYSWVNSVLESAKDSFLHNNFIFSLGYMIYTAQI